MTLTPADLARIESTAPTSLSSGELAALTALARRALELESALAHLDRLPGFSLAMRHPRDGAVGYGSLFARAILNVATEHGWPGLQSEGGKEQGEHG